ncbi:MAG: hypothetical protein NVS2B12_35420 [Ktedonobacteraceae bacterium]
MLPLDGVGMTATDNLTAIDARVAVPPFERPVTNSTHLLITNKLHR